MAAKIPTPTQLDALREEILAWITTRVALSAAESEGPVDPDDWADSDDDAANILHSIADLFGVTATDH